MNAADERAAVRLLKAACAETIRQLRAGETTYVTVLVAATTAADLLMKEAS